MSREFYTGSYKNINFKAKMRRRNTKQLYNFLNPAEVHRYANKQVEHIKTVTKELGGHYATVGPYDGHFCIDSLCNLPKP